MFEEKDRDNPSVSIIIVNYNGRKLLRRCLNSFLTMDYPNFETIIVDNASTDGSVQMVERLFGAVSDIKILENPRNLGHAQGCNVGAYAAQGRYLVFLDSDTEVWMPNDSSGEDVCSYSASNWLRELVGVMESDESIGIAQAKLVLAQDRRRLDYICIAVDALGSWNMTYGLPAAEFSENIEIFAASSGCCIVRRDVFDQTGGFDPDYFIYDDDTDFSLRTRLLGHKILLASSAIVAHRSGVLRGITENSVYHSGKNRFFTLLKNYEFRNLWWRFVILSLLTSGVAVGFLLLRNIDAARATVKGLFTPINSFKELWRKRLHIQSRRVIRDGELMQKGFIRNDIRFTLDDLKLKLKLMAREH